MYILRRCITFKICAIVHVGKNVHVDIYIYIYETVYACMYMYIYIYIHDCISMIVIVYESTLKYILINM